ncbi:cytochrome c1 [Legionella sp. CNM-4043-24]|uniref:cytochrome c1 n=1 Tax=Legionella sp. CNM-4043-24 TaxID=3421646 RepID=UPI00403ACF3A
MVFAGAAQSSLGPTLPLMPVDIDWHDRAALQRGARMYMNYCSGCHSLQYMRYNRMARDLGLTTFDGEIDTDLLQSNLIFTKARVHDPIEISMPPEDARQWFGVVPPDLSLIARKRSPSWLYTYLQSFYNDPSRPFGVNNALFPDVAMPNVLAALDGERAVVRNGSEKNAAISHLVRVTDGQMTAQQFDRSVLDLVSFLAYVAEPVKLERQRMGIFVLAFLAVFLLIVYRLKKLYWKDLKQK